ncbi:MAG: DUF47 domain-containing protein [Candidatus Thorarchaeota archaeon]|jgi:predicted phosphate transport protein (TIGR00153 family)
MVLDNGRFLNSGVGNITHLLDEHFRIALSANKVVSAAIIEWLDESKPVSEESKKKTTSLEEKGDDLKRAIINELAKANSLMQREDLLRLVHYNDKLIDGAEIACYHLAAVSKDWIPEGALKDKVAELGKMVIDTVTQQREAVRFLSINMEESIKRAEEICKIEKKIDILQREIVSILYPSEIELAILLRFSDFLNVMEEIANLSEDAAITIRSLSLTLNT